MKGVAYISFVALHVSDLARWRRFYTEGVFIERDGMRLQHQALPESVALPPVRRQMGLSHFGIRVDDLDAAIERVERFGGTAPLENRHVNEQYGSRVARVLDPDGVRMELLEMPGDVTRMPGTLVD